MAVFPLLDDPGRYRPCPVDLLCDDDARRHWLDLFESHFETQLEAAAAVGVPTGQRGRAREAFRREIAELRRQPDRHGRLDILLLDELRHSVLVEHGVIDEFAPVKHRENERALAQLPARLAFLDRCSGHDRFEALIRGMLAGNLFDMGVPDTAARFGASPPTYEELLQSVPPRPWRIDDLDAAARDWHEHAPQRTVLMADNAGPDFVLGLLPLARALLVRGGEVVMAANSAPSLNDVTAAEVRAVLERAKDIAPELATGRLRVAGTGTAAPLIDLSNVSDALCDAARDADLLVLHGMGRALESNFHAHFRCRCWKVAMVKDAQVAATVGGRVYDAVFKFEPAPGR